MTSIQTEWEGYYLDGQTAARQRVSIQLMRLGLHVTTERGDTLWWPYEEIRQTQGFYSGEQVRIERGGEFAEALLVSDKEFLVQLHQIAPELATKFHDPARRKTRGRLALLAALASIGILVVLYLWGIPALSGFVASLVPVSWEERLGQAVVEHLAPPAIRCTDTNRTPVISEILTALTTHSPTSPYTIRVILVNDSSINAFAAPGGTIVLLRGLLEKTQTPEELAGILAHELQHILNRHSTRALIQHVSMGLLLAAITGNTSGTAAYGLEGARILGSLRYSRQNEEEADAGGMRMLLEAGIDPMGMIAFLELLKKRTSESPSILKYLSTHPGTEDRIEKLKSLAGQSQHRPAKLLAGHDWSEIKKICQATSPSD
jgi:Zn-dependent protease with chaperone function